MHKQDLIDFENEIADLYKEGKIRGPIHLRDGNEDQLIDIFKDISSTDYVFSTWANHLHALLKGIPPDLVKARILESESMAMNFPEYNFYTSAIVGGICPIATGVAHALKKPNRVYCFIGDMTFRTGIAHESIMYSIQHDLPISFIVEDNGKSVCTPTKEVWGSSHRLLDFYINSCQQSEFGFYISAYKYESKYSHAGIGSFISF